MTNHNVDIQLDLQRVGLNHLAARLEAALVKNDNLEQDIANMAALNNSYIEKVKAHEAARKVSEDEIERLNKTVDRLTSELTRLQEVNNTLTIKAPKGRVVKKSASK